MPLGSDGIYLLEFLDDLPSRYFLRIQSEGILIFAKNEILRLEILVKISMLHRKKLESEHRSLELDPSRLRCRHRKGEFSP